MIKNDKPLLIVPKTTSMGRTIMLINLAISFEFHMNGLSTSENNVELKDELDMSIESLIERLEFRTLAIYFLINWQNLQEIKSWRFTVGWLRQKVAAFVSVVHNSVEAGVRNWSLSLLLVMCY